MSQKLKMTTLVVAAAAALSIGGSASAAFAWDTSGTHAFFNDDRNQFVDVWYNTNGHLTFKVSNGRPWRPMWVVAHVHYLLGGKDVRDQDYLVYCPSPNASGRGAEAWFEFAPLSVGPVNGLSVNTNKTRPWKSFPNPPLLLAASVPAP